MSVLWAVEVDACLQESIPPVGLVNTFFFYYMEKKMYFCNHNYGGVIGGKGREHCQQIPGHQ